MTLEDILLARAAEKLRVSVHPISQGYQANVSTDGRSFRVEMADDPVTALMKALGALPGASGPLWQQPEPTEDVFG